VAKEARGSASGVDESRFAFEPAFVHTVADSDDHLSISENWRRIRRVAFAAYFATLAVFVAKSGVPTGRATLAVVIVSGLALSRLGHSWRRFGQVLLDWLPFTAVLLTYDRTRSLADGLGMPLHESDILHVEKWFFGGVEPTIWLQHHLYDPAHVYWYDALCTLVYTSHFLATPILAAYLWLRDRAFWLRYISRVILLSAAGLTTYILFPQAPPWYAARDGLSEPVLRLSTRGWLWFGGDDIDSFFKDAQKDGTNPVAAMPSLHAAFAVLVAITIMMRLRSRWRYLLALYPVAMGFTLVYTGEHYVLDLVVGAGYAFAVHGVLTRWERRRTERRRADEDAVADDPALLADRQQPG
jgi:membrane-associated phospholipid phosphatase